MPWNTSQLLLCLFDPALQFAIGEGVAFVEIKVAFVFKEATPSFRQNIPDSIGGDDGGGEVDEVFASRLQLDALVPHHRELSWLADEQVEGAVLLVHGAKGDLVGVEVQGEPQPILPSLLGINFPRSSLSL